ncbi:hypothetical protein LTR37_009369 [Vermiconidia calcicola]|uniref:Uncharacterized protein n=1 Tax=Vermiconidia calcicola TaxID=1690605 RepID=A0ACC3NAR2_9PEZI|nr:hypothetical protein LTR37_009369 [Vermiconidia calcicola]
MPPTTAQNDDYVVSLLLRDAEANKKRYLTNSLGSSLRSSSKPGNAPKPNTRFLRNVIRETDSHNAALKAREEEESRARLSELRKGKRRREDEVEEGSEKRRRKEEKAGRWASAFGGLGGKSEKRDGGRRHGERSERRHNERHERPAEREHISRKRHTHAHDKTEEREGSERRDGKRSGCGREEAQERSFRRGHGSEGPGRRAHEEKDNRPISNEHKQHPKQRRKSRSPSHSPPRHSHDIKANNSDDSDDSDPLSSFLGPKPPPTVLPRGRGAYKTSATIDTRFNPSYNPKTDVDLFPDESGERDDWDMALEALRDRAKWRVQGSKRLRDAGFTEKEVGKWEKGGEKGVEDVTWRKRGEGREWDRGKVVDEVDGTVDLKPEWGRLKDA